MGNDKEEKENITATTEEEEGSGEEEYAVEKIISHRQTRKGLEYFVKWEGFSDADNTWEPKDNLNCPDLVEAYTKECNRKDEAKKSEKSASAKQQKSNKVKEEKKVKKRKSTAEDVGSGGKKKADKMNGFDKGFTAEEIIGATEDNGQVLFLIKWKEAMQDYELIPSKTVNQKIPQMVIAFYEARLTWSSGATAEEAGAKNSEEEGEEEEAPVTNGNAEVAVS